MTAVADAGTWFAGLPGVVVAAGALITDDDGRVLLVKPNYRELWSLPGGICEFGEPPQDGCRREVAEELGLTLDIGRLLVTDWTRPFGAHARPMMHFIFDGGVLPADSVITVQQEELDGYRFTDQAQLPGYLPSFALPRVTGAVAARRAGAAVFLPHPVG